MSFFDIKICTQRACINWRIGDICAKDNMYIPNYIKYSANIHDSEMCEVRRQINTFRLQELLEKN